MEPLNKEPKGATYPQFREDESLYKNNDDVVNEDVDEDDQNLADDDIQGRDLDTDNADEWDEDNVGETDLDKEDLRDDEEVNYDLHQIKNDQFGSLASEIGDRQNPNK